MLARNTTYFKNDLLALNDSFVCEFCEMAQAKSSPVKSTLLCNRLI
jgi:hypothetical protein